MKRIIGLLLVVVVMALSLVSCGGGKGVEGAWLLEDAKVSGGGIDQTLKGAFEEYKKSVGVEFSMPRIELIMEENATATFKLTVDGKFMNEIVTAMGSTDSKSVPEKFKAGIEFTIAGYKKGDKGVVDFKFDDLVTIADFVNVYNYGIMPTDSDVINQIKTVGEISKDGKFIVKMTHPLTPDTIVEITFKRP